MLQWGVTAPCLSIAQGGLISTAQYDPCSKRPTPNHGYQSKPAVAAVAAVALTATHPGFWQSAVHVVGGTIVPFAQFAGHSPFTGLDGDPGQSMPRALLTSPKQARNRTELDFIIQFYTHKAVTCKMKANAQCLCRQLNDFFRPLLATLELVVDRRRRALNVLMPLYSSRQVPV